MTRNMAILHFCMVQYSLISYKSLQSSMLHMSKSEVFVSKRVKYSYFWSFSEYGEENKKFLELNSTGRGVISTKMGHFRAPSTRSKSLVTLR